MSITQGGNGFPFLAECVYKYFCSESTGISVPTDKVPDQTLRFALQKVHKCSTGASRCLCYLKFKLMLIYS